MSKDSPATPTPTTTVVQGGSPSVRVEGDAAQGWKVEPIIPSGAPNSEEHSRASQEDGPRAMPTPEALAEEELPSAWEAVSPAKDPADRGD